MTLCRLWNFVVVLIFKRKSGKFRQLRKHIIYSLSCFVCHTLLLSFWFGKNAHYYSLFSCSYSTLLANCGMSRKRFIHFACFWIKVKLLCYTSRSNGRCLRHTPTLTTCGAKITLARLEWPRIKGYHCLQVAWDQDNVAND